MTTQQVVEEILRRLGLAGSAVAVLGAVGGVAYGLFLWIGRKWLENRFQRQLEEHKKLQEQQLERFAMDLRSLYNRISKIQDRQFEVLPQLWDKLCDAREQVESVTSPLQSIHNLASMPEETFEEFVAASQFLPSHQDGLRRAKGDERQKLYQELLYHYRSTDAWNAVNQLHKYVRRNKLFLDIDLESCVRQLDKIMWEALMEHQDRRSAPPMMAVVDGQRKAIHFDYDGLVKKMNPLMDEIEALIRQRLRYHDAL